MFSQCDSSKIVHNEILVVWSHRNLVNSNIFAMGNEVLAMRTHKNLINYDASPARQCKDIVNNDVVASWNHKNCLNTDALITCLFKQMENEVIGAWSYKNRVNNVVLAMRRGRTTINKSVSQCRVTTA